VEFCNFRLEVGALVSQESELADVAWLVAVRIVVTQFGYVCMNVCIVEQEKAKPRSRKTTTTTKKKHETL
jgi:UV DNA damage repair endonuclease